MMSAKDLEEFAINTGQKEDRGPLDLTLLLEQADNKIKQLKDVINGHQALHDSDKQQIFNFSSASTIFCSCLSNSSICCGCSPIPTELFRYIFTVAWAADISASYLSLKAFINPILCILDILG